MLNGEHPHERRWIIRRVKQLAEPIASGISELFIVLVKRPLPKPVPFRLWVNGYDYHLIFLIENRLNLQD